MIRKHSVTLNGHRTSFSVEDEFLAVLRSMADEAGLSFAELVMRIDSARPADANLSSALRLAALNWALSRINS